MYDSGMARLFMLRPDMARDSDYDITLVGGNVLALMLHFVFWLIVLVLIELGAFDWITRYLKLLKKN